jgi:hypothetical protein
MVKFSEGYPKCAAGPSTDRTSQYSPIGAFEPFISTSLPIFERTPLIPYHLYYLVNRVSSEFQGTPGFPKLPNHLQQYQSPNEIQVAVSIFDKAVSCLGFCMALSPILCLLGR